MLRLAFTADALVLLPRVAGLREILPLVRATAFRARKRCARYASRDEPHAGEVVQVDPFRIEARPGRRQLEARRIDMAQCALEPRSAAQRSDVAVHYRLQRGDLGRRVEVRPRAI